MWFSYRDARAAHVRTRQQVTDEGARNILQESERSSSYPGRDGIVQVPVVHDVVAGGWQLAIVRPKAAPNGHVDLERLRVRLFVRQDANQYVEPHTAEGD
jgi:hypothetical protein